MATSTGRHGSGPNASVVLRKVPVGGNYLVVEATGPEHVGSAVGRSPSLLSSGLRKPRGGTAVRAIRAYVGGRSSLGTFPRVSLSGLSGWPCTLQRHVDVLARWRPEATWPKSTAVGRFAITPFGGGFEIAAEGRSDTGRQKRQ
ncbi:hypothetical protein R1flu_011252 [Riccia fluitans]|uniref:Uncharacterized protein n=1 Tax=Riccia fluitans TaxID=41844 RepID=A0ABD1Z7A3_9MARC